MSHPQVSIFKYVGCWESSNPQDAIFKICQDHKTDVATISKVPLSCKERIKIISLVINAKTAFRFAPYFDTIEQKLTQLQEINVDCVTSVKGIPRRTINKTLQSKIPFGFGMGRLHTRTKSMFLTAWMKLSQRMPSLFAPTGCFNFITNTVLLYTSS